MRRTVAQLQAVRELVADYCALAFALLLVLGWALLAWLHNKFPPPD